MEVYDNLLTDIHGFYERLGQRYELIYPGYEQLQKDLAGSLLSKLDEFGVSSIADVACGCGWLLQELAKLRSDLVLCGFDVSERAIAIAETRREKEGLEIHYYRDDWLRLQEAIDCKFEAVLCLGNSLSHLPSNLQGVALTKFASILKPGGVLLIDTYRNWNDSFSERVIVEPQGQSVQGSYRVTVCFANEYRNGFVQRHVCFSYYPLAQERALRPDKSECFSIRQFPVIIQNNANVKDFGFKNCSVCQIQDELAKFEYYLLVK